MCFHFAASPTRERAARVDLSTQYLHTDCKLIFCYVPETWQLATSRSNLEQFGQGC
jgi:hypothetical protein